MFFYLHCGWGFNCLHGRRKKRCLISCFLCGNPQNNFGPHKAPRHTFWHIWTSPLASRPLLNTCNITFSWDYAQAIVYCDVCPVFQCLCLILRQQTSPCHMWNLTLHWGKLWRNYWGRTAKSRLREVGPSAKYLVEIFLPLSKNHYSHACQ